MPTHPPRLQTLFLVAVDIHDPAERARFLDDACEGEPALKARVEALLRAHDQPDSLLDRPVAEFAPPVGNTPDPANAHTNEFHFGFLAPATRTGSLGRIGHYEVLQVLGEGGFGIVFRAFDDTLQRVVAVKVLAPLMAITSPARKRFLREARSSAQVRHENVVQVYEVGEQPLPYLVMEFIPGETLQERLDRAGPLDVSAVLRIGRQIAEALAAAHATDLIHRDIKPGNVLLEGGTQKLKITDFGLARAADDASLSHSGIVAGTPMYMAPEQAKGEPLDQRVDLFSLGSVLYQMVTGRPPFRAEGTLTVLKRVAEDTPRPIREIIPETPRWLCNIIAKLHAKNPADRFQSARELADLLADCEAQWKETGRVKSIAVAKLSSTSLSRKWGVWAAAALSLGILTLVAMEIAGVTHLLRREELATRSQPTGTGLPPSTPTEVAKKDPVAPPAVDPDARAAAYVFHIGGAVRANDMTDDIRLPVDLPPKPYILTSVLLNGNHRVDDVGLANLTGCKHLSRLELGCEGVSDAGLAHLSSCVNLTKLNLHDNKRMTDAGLAHLKDCRKLTHLLLSNVIQVGDAGLIHLKGHNQLQYLLLYGTGVTDAGLVHLTGLTQLKNLDLHNTKVTRAGVEELAVALPKCRIRWDGGTLGPE